MYTRIRKTRCYSFSATTKDNTHSWRSMFTWHARRSCNSVRVDCAHLSEQSFSRKFFLPSHTPRAQSNFSFAAIIACLHCVDILLYDPPSPTLDSPPWRTWLLSSSEQFPSIKRSVHPSRRLPRLSSCGKCGKGRRREQTVLLWDPHAFQIRV